MSITTYKIHIKRKTGDISILELIDNIPVGSIVIYGKSIDAVITEIASLRAEWTTNK